MKHLYTPAVYKYIYSFCHGTTSAQTKAFLQPLLVSFNPINIYCDLRGTSTTLVLSGIFSITKLKWIDTLLCLKTLLWRRVHIWNHCMCVLKCVCYARAHLWSQTSGGRSVQFLLQRKYRYKNKRCTRKDLLIFRFFICHCSYAVRYKIINIHHF